MESAQSSKLETAQCVLPPHSRGECGGVYVARSDNDEHDGDRQARGLSTRRCEATDGDSRREADGFVVLSSESSLHRLS